MVGSRVCASRFLLIRGRTIVVMFVHRGLVPRSFTVALAQAHGAVRSSPYLPACLSSYVRYISYHTDLIPLCFSQFLELIVALVSDHPDNFQPGTLTSSR
jgi:hypothetical protein